ncbi:MAG: helix-turn-helix domain-containing protein [Oscillospiraceae bacterium]|nr:helix-turn-helix domain-containing protein [Oscillospiraceae bacterium]
MYELSKEKFGTFLVQLRKEKGMTQKDLAERLFVSDKAVSKWERGLSLPDISLLQPLAALLDVTVTELLSGRYIEKDRALTVQEVEPLLTGALSMTAQERENQRKHRRQWGLRLLMAVLACAVEVWLLWGSPWLWDDLSVTLWLPPAMGLGFGVYLCLFSREKLPAFYDQNQINFVSDGAFRMNMPGVYFNNRNWPHILNAMRAWCCAALAGWIPLYCLVRWALSYVLPEGLALSMVLLFFSLAGILGGLFLPVVTVSRKYK